MTGRHLKVKSEEGTSASSKTLVNTDRKKKTKHFQFQVSCHHRILTAVKYLSFYFEVAPSRRVGSARAKKDGTGAG